MDSPERPAAPGQSDIGAVLDLVHALRAVQANTPPVPRGIRGAGIEANGHVAAALARFRANATEFHHRLSLNIDTVIGDLDLVAAQIAAAELDNVDVGTVVNRAQD
ncbi:hypothetical protein [Tsukamurella paurometabola]|uniref:PE domain-containing protein n=1 Tax=Tsukamurella paurometabola TaxID=2061 RepID=A0ABS5NGV1_TSUPA|nr:hypothetical protein [Tsukamurella paurometabola]MBS4102847.1 hypothetical protein [Tsukamurella paurometabola]